MMRGEVWSVRLPAPSGHEQGGQRPAVILQDDAYGQRSPLVLVVPLTSQIGALRFPATLQLSPTAGSGLSLSSVALVFQARAVDRARFVQRLGILPPEDLDKLLDLLNRLTGQ